MKILVVNPNSTESMTALIEGCARAVAGPGVLVDAVHPDSAPAAIETHADEVAAVPGVVAAVRAGRAAGYDAFVVACFGDPGVDESRGVAGGAPVLGIAEAAMRAAAALDGRFTVLTTPGAGVGATLDLVRRHGVADRCAGVRAGDLPVLALEGPGAEDQVAQAATAALAADGADVLVLGCAGMARMAPGLAARLGVPVVEGVAAATLSLTRAAAPRACWPIPGGARRRPGGTLTAPSLARRA